MRARILRVNSIGEEEIGGNESKKGALRNKLINLKKFEK